MEVDMEIKRKKQNEINEQIQLIKILAKKLPNPDQKIGEYGYADVPKTQLLTDIKKLRRELMNLADMIKYHC